MQAERRRPSPAKLSWPDLLKLMGVFVAAATALVAAAVYGKLDARYVKKEDALEEIDANTTHRIEANVQLKSISKTLDKVDAKMDRLLSAPR